MAQPAIAWEAFFWGGAGGEKDNRDYKDHREINDHADYIGCDFVVVPAVPAVPARFFTPFRMTKCSSEPIETHRNPSFLRVYKSIPARAWEAFFLGGAGGEKDNRDYKDHREINDHADYIGCDFVVVPAVPAVPARFFTPFRMTKCSSEPIETHRNP